MCGLKPLYVTAPIPITLTPAFDAPCAQGASLQCDLALALTVRGDAMAMREAEALARRALATLQEQHALVGDG